MTWLYFTILLIVLVLAYVLLRRFLEEKLTGKGDNSLIMLQNQIAELNRTMDAKLGESSKELREEMSKSAKMAQDIIKEVTRELTKIGESNKQVMSITDQLKSLQDILKNPKHRGVLGETMLETVLQNVLPPGSYQTQYPFSDGEIVDAVIFFGGKVIPIDAKFSLENYSRILTAPNDQDRKRFEDSFRMDLKNRIDEVVKYIKPSEDTYDFAFMFIPSEAIYYDLLVNKVGAVSAQDLVEYAGNKKVTIVSPTTLVAYLNTILQGLKQIEFNKSAEQIRKRVEDLIKHLAAYDVFFKKLGDNLGTAVNSYNKASKELGKIDKDILKITGKEIGTEQLSLEQPLFDEE